MQNNDTVTHITIQMPCVTIVHDGIGRTSWIDSWKFRSDKKKSNAQTQQTRNLTDACSWHRIKQLAGSTNNMCAQTVTNQFEIFHRNSIHFRVCSCRFGQICRSQWHIMAYSFIIIAFRPFTPFDNANIYSITACDLSSHFIQPRMILISIDVAMNDECDRCTCVKMKFDRPRIEQIGLVEMIIEAEKWTTTKHNMKVTKISPMIHFSRTYGFMHRNLTLSRGSSLFPHAKRNCPIVASSEFFK